MTRITGTTRLAGVVGRPLAHSLSPAMHNAAYEHLGLDWAYLPFEVVDEVGLRRFVAAVRSLNFVGFNVTMPYKTEMLELCDEVATAARMAGAVNAVHCSEGKLVGYNTDGRGLLEALELEAGFVPADKHIVLIGAGGAAGGALVAFILARAARVTVVNRDPGRAEELVERMRPHLRGVDARAAALSSAEEAVREADLVVNATPVGMDDDGLSPVPISWIRPAQVVYDMVYGTARPTALVSGSREVGAVAMDGLGMLVCQGATAIDIWSGNETRAPRDVMRQAAVADLELRGAAR